MTDETILAREFEAHRAHLTGVALRLLGSHAAADDAVQEAWLRLTRTDASTIENVGGWLTTVVSRISLDQLRSRASRREDGDTAPERAGSEPDPEQEAVLAEQVGEALAVVLDALTPAERLSFVLHDLFAVPFDEIGAIAGRSPDAAKMLASRARRKVQGAGTRPSFDPVRQQATLDAFLAAAHGGELADLVALLDPDVVLEADAAAADMGAPAELLGAPAVAGMFHGRAEMAKVRLIDGVPGLVWSVGGKPKVAWDFTVVDGQVTRIDMLADPDLLAELTFG